MASVLQLLLLASVLSAPPAAGEGNHLLTAPQPAAVEIGSDFTATCAIVDTAEVTADDLYWNLSKTTVPEGRYARINDTALNVTVRVAGEQPEWLFCLCKKVSSAVDLHQGRCIHGILLNKGYVPTKPENLSCLALQDKAAISSTITCRWLPAGRQTEGVPTKYTLMLKIIGVSTHNVTTAETSASITLNSFPNYMELEIWVEARNQLGSVESEHLLKESGYFVKTDPPTNIWIVSETSFPYSLVINWKAPIDTRYVKLTYEIRFCPSRSHLWSYVPHVDTAENTESFRLQSLTPDTDYVTQVRCKHRSKSFGHWSEWSANSTERTPEGQPTSKPDLWRVTTEEDEGRGGRRVRSVRLVCKAPVAANGRILRYDLKFQQEKKEKVRNATWEPASFLANASDQRGASVLKEVLLDPKKSLKVHVTAVNSVGSSPPASLFIPDEAHQLPPVEDLKAWTQGGRLWLGWTPPKVPVPSEYVVEWEMGGAMDWQRENRSSRQAAIRGDLEKYVRYALSVYPVYSGWTGRPAGVQAYLDQREPLDGPIVRLGGKPGHNEAELVWAEIPVGRRRGFITNYTIYYTSGGEVHTVVVPATTTAYTLTSLAGNTKYDTWVEASTVAGSTRGSSHSFTTLKYAPGEIELIVVGASLGFLSVVVMTMLLCLYKRDVIKRNFWPQIPDPGESTLGNWSPDFPVKAETPKENCLSEISVLDEDACDGKSLEEDKAPLPLKKDKYLSEEHSSGIGGSSCMSSPRQSVSDSDEGGDMADTTASTVQYSSVVASSGYKGQTPGGPAPFARSESTQPLLDSEESQEAPEDSRQSRRFLAGGGAGQLLEMEREGVEPLDFCPLEEERADEPSADWLQAANFSSYMPQLGGYRPQ